MVSFVFVIVWLIIKDFSQKKERGGIPDIISQITIICLDCEIPACFKDLKFILNSILVKNSI